MLGIASCNLGAAVGGTVVHQQQFPVRVSLPQYTFDRFLNEPLRVQKDNSDRYQRLVA